MPAPVFSSPKTSLAAVAILVLAAGYVALEVANGNIANIEWTAVASGVIAAIGFFFARDGDKSSEDVGLK